MAAVHRGMLLRALPFVVVLFLFFPRLPPLWGQQMVDYGKPVGHLHQLPLSVNYYCRNHL